MLPDPAHERVPGKGLQRLQDLMGRLRGPDGCPWDREQTLESLKPFLVEETYELLEAIDSEDPEQHAEELGDVLLQVVFQSRLCEELGYFDLDEVAHRISDKLVRRHPHVFGKAKVTGSEEVVRNWEAIKAREKDDGSPRSAVDGVPANLPALLRAQRLQTKAARVGFDWPDRNGPDRKLDEELGELREAVDQGDAAAIRHEIGDLLFSLVNLCRFLDVDAEESLRLCANRFEARFRAVERRLRSEGREMRDCSLETLDAHWEAAKASVS